jgi:hypothetical protein
MVTLLLTFFVMLLSLADVQDPELFDKGRDAFLESIRYVGLGFFFGREKTPHFGSLKNKYFIPNPDELSDRRTIDAEAEELRRIFEKLKQLTIVKPSQIVAERTNFSLTNVHFSPGGVSLNESARKFLSGFCRDLQQDVSRESVELYVLGLASDGKSQKQQLLLSAKRAKAVEDFLRETLSSTSVYPRQRNVFKGQSKWSVYSWGAGSGGDWVGRDSPISRQSQILIAVMRGSD